MTDKINTGGPANQLGDTAMTNQNAPERINLVQASGMVSDYWRGNYAASCEDGVEYVRADIHRIASEQAAENKRLRDALSMLISMSDNHSPFGGEIYQDRVDRAWDNARAALKGGAA